jgi:hypothetical protein
MGEPDKRNNKCVEDGGKNSYVTLRSRCNLLHSGHEGWIDSYSYILLYKSEFEFRLYTEILTDNFVGLISLCRNIMGSYL